MSASASASGRRCARCANPFETLSRRSGFPRNLQLYVNYLAEGFMAAQFEYDVFISYSQKEREAATRLQAAFATASRFARRALGR